jgi:Tim17/Tim22/Tim23/Pmp24 family
MLIVQLPGLALGGVWGVREGARRPLAVSNTRLRINSILNSVTRRGTFIGNSAGVLGMPSALPALFTSPYCFLTRNQLQLLCITELIHQSTPCAGNTTYLAAWQRAQ